jgi:hypothetical protein
LIKFLHKYYNKKDAPWVCWIWFAYDRKIPHEKKLGGSFWWTDMLKQVDNFRGVAPVSHGHGDTLLFWTAN